MEHPEYNSTLILRSETINESEAENDFPSSIPCFEDLRPVKNIHRKLLPRRPGRDPPIEQHCTFYEESQTLCSSQSHDNSPPSISCLVLSPVSKPGEPLPYYHPSVSHLAIRYLPMDNTSSADHGGCAIQIEVIPMRDAPDPHDLNSRLYRTCLALLETVHRYGWGALTNYKKRVEHDCIIPREEYQDLYLLMRERHKHLVDAWHEATDPLKHVFEVRSSCID